MQAELLLAKGRSQCRFLHDDVRTADDRKNPLALKNLSHQEVDHKAISILAQTPTNVVEKILGLHRIKP